MPTEVIVRCCAPTLAGIKVGNLFSHRYTDAEDVVDTVKRQNRQLNPKGVYMELVKMADGFALVYVYRKRRLEELLAKQEIQEFLRPYGYHGQSVEENLVVLKERLQKDDFPHDIGIFLDYPVEDVKAFIANKGANCPLTGCWKAYHNVSEAERKFRSYKRCTEVYCQRYGEGVDIVRLTVAG